MNFTLSKVFVFERPAQDLLLILKKQRFNTHFKQTEEKIIRAEQSSLTDMNRQISAEET